MFHSNHILFRLFDHDHQDLTPYIHLEQRKPQGTENLYGLLHSIKNKVLIKFRYHKFWDEKSSHRVVQPLALKEFKNRWYVIAKDTKEDHIKSFGLDRLSNLEITNHKFSYPADYNVTESYMHSFGVIGFEEEKLRDITL